MNNEAHAINHYVKYFEERTCMEKESINSPPHYQGNSMEAIDIIDAYSLNFARGNAIKYILRAGKKGSEKEDLQKAIWYINHEIERLKE